VKRSLNIFKKATKHFKRIEKKANFKLCHTQNGKLDHYNCIFLVVVAKISLLVQKQKPWAKPEKIKKSHGHKVMNFSVCAKKCGLRLEKKGSGHVGLM